MDDFVVVYEFLFYFTDELFESLLDLGPVLLGTVNGDGRQFFVGFNKALVLVFELFHLHAVVPEKSFENWRRYSMELNLVFGQTVALYHWQLAKY